MDSAFSRIRKLLALSPVRAALTDARPAWLLAADNGEILFMNRAGARLLGDGQRARFSSSDGASLARQILDRSHSAPMVALRFGSHLAPAALPAQVSPAGKVDGRDTLVVIAARTLARPEGDQRSLDDLVAGLGETGATYGLFDADAGLVAGSGPEALLSAAFEAAFPDPLDMLGDEFAPAPVKARDGGLVFDGTVYPFVDDDIARFLILGTHAAAEAEAPAPVSGEAVETAADTPAVPTGRVVRFVFETDNHGRLVFVSRDAGEIFRAIEGDPVGRALEEICDPLDLAAQTRIAATLVSLETFCDLEVPVPARGFGRAVVRLAGVPIFNPPGVFRGYRGVGLVTGAPAGPEDASSDRQNGAAAPSAADTASAAGTADPAETGNPPARGANEDHAVFAIVDPGPGSASGPVPASGADSTPGVVGAPEPDGDDEGPRKGSPAPRTSRNVVALGRARLPDARPMAPEEQAALERIASSIETAFGTEKAGTDGRPRPASVHKESPAPTGDATVQPQAPDAGAAPKTVATADDAAMAPSAGAGKSQDGPGAKPPPPSAAAAVPTTDLKSATIIQHPNAVTMAEQAALLERLPLGIVIFRDDEVAYANRAFFELLGYRSLGDLRQIGGIDAIFPVQSLQDPGEAAAGARQTLRATRRDGDTVDVVARLQSIPYGGETCLMLSLRAVQSGDDVPVPSDGASDPSAARIAELNTIIDTATDGIVVINPDGTIDRMNTGAESLFGISNAEQAGKPFASLFTPESQSEVRAYLADLAQNGVASLLNDGREMTGRFKSGGAIPLFVTVGRITGEHGSKFCAVLRDITHFKSTETELVRARKRAEDANAHKSDFLARISHEIRTPLNSIIGFSEVMMTEAFGAMAHDRYREYASDIHNCGTHLLSLIDDLLDLSKVEAGKLDLTFTGVDIGGLVAECVSTVQPDANKQRIIVRTNLPPTVPPVVADERSLRQIILNILSNSIKFTPAGGQIIASTRLDERGEVTLSIRDTGIGMSKSDLEIALEPFRQVPLERGQKKGTGLGLPLTKALTEANRARLDIESAPAEGTMIRITFPVTRVLAE